ncbi:MAG: hypothetical protein C0502_02900 [Opitutus sp.]|nr:hypothetical protein [Opitutus sp.]
MNAKPLLVTLVLVAVCAARESAPIEIPAAGGRFVLPLTGLAVSFPANADVRTELKGSWSLSTSFDARDVIDELKDGKLVGGTWVLTGHFDAGDARAAVQSADLADAWPTTTLEAWGLTWQVRGGKFEFAGALGAQSTIVLAAQRSENYPTLLLYRHFIGEPDVSGEAMLARVKSSPLIAAIVKAYRDYHFGASFPTRHPAVRNRGNSPPDRTVLLKRSGLQVALPDDGYVWWPKEASEGGTDFLHRLGPTFPELSLDVLVVDAPAVPAAWSSLGLSPPPAGTVIANLPDGWVVGPEVTPSSGKESTIAKLVGDRVLIVGLIANTVTTDVETLRPILEALAASIAKKNAAH